MKKTLDKAVKEIGQYREEIEKKLISIFGIEAYESDIKEEYIKTNDKNILSILFNSNDGVYDNNQVEVILKEKGYLIISDENTIYG